MISKKDADAIAAVALIYLPIEQAQQMFGDFTRSRAADVDPNLRETFRSVAAALNERRRSSE